MSARAADTLHLGEKMANRVHSAAAIDPRSMVARDRLKNHWKTWVKKQSPAVQRDWLRSSEGIVAMGAKTAHDMAKEIERREKAIRAVTCGSAPADAYDNGGEMPVGLRFNSKGSVVPEATERRHGSRLVLSRERVRQGVEGRPGELPTSSVGSRRYTPANAVGVEDLLDGMDGDEAMMHHFPSPSAIAIGRLGMMLQKAAKCGKRVNERDFLQSAA